MWLACLWLLGAALFGPDAVPCNGRISNSFYNFDNVANGMVSVFIMCTYEPTPP